MTPRRSDNVYLRTDITFRLYSYILRTLFYIWIACNC